LRVDEENYQTSRSESSCLPTGEPEPRLFVCHFWANDDAIKLAKGLRAALDKAAVVVQ
jgi:Domain of Unknown Function (DUF1259)